MKISISLSIVSSPAAQLPNRTILEEISFERSMNGSISRRVRSILNSLQEILHVRPVYYQPAFVLFKDESGFF